VELTTRVIRPVVLQVTDLPPIRRLVSQTRPGRALARRFVAGETLAEAMSAARELDRRRATAMLNHLGENVTTPQQALEARASYLAAVDEIAQNPTLDVAVSVKLTQLGLDVSVDECWAHLEPVLRSADVHALVVMIDMESHAYVDATLEILRRAHARSPRVGVCLQSYLRRTERDVFELPPGCRIRLVKGAYLEPADVVYGSKRDVDDAYRRTFVTLFARGHPIDVATHDPALLDGIRRRVDATESGWSRVEFQMMYGVRRDLQASLAGRGYPVRVYIPYGTEWYPYLTRRLAERPANVWFFLSNLMRMR
jgi:proline dehydrogenase